MNFIAVLTVFLASAVSPLVAQNLADTILKTGTAVTNAVNNAVNAVDRKADNVIDTIDSAAKTTADNTNKAVDTAKDILLSLIAKTEELLLPTDGCIKGKLEDLNNKESTFGTDLLQCVLDGNKEVRDIKTTGVNDILAVNNNFKELLKETCDGWWDCGKLIVKFTTEEGIAIGKCFSMVISIGAQLEAAGTKAVACLGTVAASYTGQTTGIIDETGKCITDLFTNSNNQHLLN